MNPDEEKIKTTINELLFHAGKYNIVALDSMMFDKAMLGISSLKDGTWSQSEIAINDYFESVKTESAILTAKYQMTIILLLQKVRLLWLES